MFRKMLSRDSRFRGGAIEMTAYLTAAATQLRELFADPAGLNGRVAEIDALARKTGVIAHEVEAQLDTALVTPIDREDIHDLAWELDRVGHLIRETAHRAAMYGITEAREPAVRLAGVLIRACEGLEVVVTHVRMPAAVRESRRAVKLLEEEADVIYMQAVGALFSGRPNALEVLKWKDLYDQLEEAVDGCDHAASAVAHAAIAQL